MIIFYALLISVFSFANKTVATVNCKNITSTDLDLRVAEVQRAFFGVLPTRAQVLEDMINRELVIAEAKRMKLDQRPATIQKIEEVLFQTYIDEALGPEFDKVSPKDSDLKSFYEASPEIRLSQIFVAAPEGSPADRLEATRSHLNKIRTDELLSGKTSFSEAAQKHSESADAPTGGDLDYQPKTRLDPALYSAGRALRPGGISSVIQTTQGFHIIKLDGVRSYKDANKARVRAQYLETRQRALYQNAMKNLRAKGQVILP